MMREKKEHGQSETEIERGEGGGGEIGLISSEEGDQCGKSGRRGVGLLDYGMRKELPRDEACQERREGTGCGLGIEEG